MTINFQSNIILQAKMAKEQQGLTCQMISEKAKAIGLPISEKSVSRVINWDGKRNFQSYTLFAVAKALGVNLESSEIVNALLLDLGKAEDRVTSLEEVTVRQAEQIESMRGTIHNHETKEAEMRRSIRWLVVGLVLLLAVFMVGFALDFLQPNVGWLLR